MAVSFYKRLHKFISNAIFFPLRKKIITSEFSLNEKNMTKSDNILLLDSFTRTFFDVTFLHFLLVTD